MANLLSNAAALASFAVYLLLLPYAVAFRIVASVASSWLPRLPPFDSVYRRAERAELSIYSWLCAIADTLGLAIQHIPALKTGEAVLVSPSTPEDLLLTLCESYKVFVPVDSETQERRLSVLAGAHSDNLCFLRGQDWAAAVKTVGEWIIGDATSKQGQRRLAAVVVASPPDSSLGQTLDQLPPEQLQQIMEARMLAAHRLVIAAVPLLRRSNGGRILAIFPPSPPGSKVADAGIKALLDNLRPELASDRIGITILEHGKLKIQRRGSIKRQSIDVKELPRSGWTVPAITSAAITDASVHALTARFVPPYLAIGMDVKLDRVARFFRGT